MFLKQIFQLKIQLSYVQVQMEIVVKAKEIFIQIIQISPSQILYVYLIILSWS